MFRSPRSAPAELKETASFKQYIDFYTERVGLSENKLALCARLYQQRLNKISNGKIKNANIETLVCICLPLGLDVTEAKDLLARYERSFSPAKPIHTVYLELIEIYSERDIDYSHLEDILDYADEYLIEHGYHPLPDICSEK